MLLSCSILMATALSVVVVDSSSLKNPLPDSFEFSSEDKPTIVQEKPEDLLSNIVEEVGTTVPQKFSQKTYNEPTPTRVCFNEITYVKEMKSSSKPWRVYEVIFSFPGDKNDEKRDDKEQAVKETLHYRVRNSETDKVELLNFTVIEKNDNYKLSKHEKLFCGKGSFLTKTFYEWSNEPKRKIAIRLTDNAQHDREIRHSEYEYYLKSLKSRSDTMLGTEAETANSTTHQKKNNSEATNGQANVNHVWSQITNNTSQSSTSVISMNKSQTYEEVSDNESTNIKEETNSDKDSDVIVGAIRQDETPEKKKEKKVPLIDGWSIFENSLERSSAVTYVSYDNDQEEVTQSQSGSSNPVNYCPPFVEKLLTGNTLLPALCSLKKNEKLLVKGDITVKKRYFSKEENKEVEEPLYVIHENSEVEA